MQTRAEVAYSETRYLAALQLTMSARERALRALQLCNASETFDDTVANALQRTDDVLARVHDAVDTNGTDRARQMLANADNVQVRAKAEAQAGHPRLALRLTRQATEMKGQLAEVRSRKANATGAFRAQADEDLAKSRGDLAVLEENIKSAQDRVRRADLKSPVYGIVNKINVTTIGAVVQPGASLMEIVPLEDTLLVEGRIRPQDIAFIRPDQDAVVKISAYDSNVYGHLNGRVERISADTIADEKAANKEEKAETFYRVMVRTDTNHLGTTAHPLPIIPGMVATVEVLTGHKTVLDYLVKPARMLRDEALRER